MKKGFTLMEILIVVALIVALATALLITLNPLAQINKGQDSKRKHELTQLNKVFEDFYNDKQCYPKPDEVCYKDKTSTVCPICGNDAGSPDFNPYLPQLPCDPRHSQKKYLYQIDDTTCPTYYRIYTTLSNTADPVAANSAADLPLILVTTTAFPALILVWSQTTIYAVLHPLYILTLSVIFVELIVNVKLIILAKFIILIPASVQSPVLKIDFHY